MNQLLSNKIITGIVALALLVGVGVLISSRDTSSITRNAALVAPTAPDAIGLTCATGGTCKVGDAGPGGGTVFYVADTPQTWTYLEAAPTDYQVSGERARVTWGAAADVANNYSTSTASAGQWRLPSKDELNELCKIHSNGRTDTTRWAHTQKGCTGSTSPTGGFAADYYWSYLDCSCTVLSSGQYSQYYPAAWAQYFSYGTQGKLIKDDPFFVRPVRAFK